MSEQRWHNFSSCCRLCLSDKLDTLKSIFEDVGRSREIVKNIQTCLEIEVAANNQLSTMICKSCLMKVMSWCSYKKSCQDNQNKLNDWMSAWKNVNSTEVVNVQIKDEVVEDGGGLQSPPCQVNVDENGVVHVKSEPTSVCSDSEGVPETVSPVEYLNYENEKGGDAEDEEDRLGLEGEAVNGSITVSDVDPLEDLQQDETICQVCGKSFNSSANRRRHEYAAHKKAKELKTTKIPLYTTSERPSAITQNESEAHKIQFAAGLKLQQRVEILEDEEEDELLTKVELSYLDKCRTIIRMSETLVCVCHEEKFGDQKGLFVHLKKMRTWFALFTCYNCLVSFSDRPTYMKHFCACTRPVLENLKRLANTTIDHKIKIRIYQSYKCMKCDCIFSFLDDYSSHFVEEHASAEEGPPYKCKCAKVFEKVDEYKMHSHSPCFMKYFCDICFGSFNSMDAFKAHCEKEHDHAEGNSLDSYDSYYKGKAPEDVMSSKRSLPVESNINNAIKRRRAVNIPTEDPEYVEPNDLSSSVGFRNMKSSKPTACPVCDKLYSSYHNMLRHYKQSHDESGRLLCCMYCPEKFRLISEVKEHEALIHGVESPSTEDTSTTGSMASDQCKFACPICGETFKTLDDWTTHTKTHPQHTCEECGKHFLMENELKQHRKVHLNIKVYRDAETKDYKSAMARSPNLICLICEKSFADKNELEQHKLVHDENSTDDGEGENSLMENTKDLSRKYSCETCNKHYVSYGGIWDHNKKYHSGLSVANSSVEYTSSGEYRRPCAECPKILSSKAGWINHQKMHDRINSQRGTLYSEYEEEQSFRSRPKSRGSQKEEEDDDAESYFTCKRCFKVFSSKYALKNHMKCHGIVSNSMSSSNRSSMKTGKVIKTYWCDICHQACPGYAELQEHKQQHRKQNRPTPTEKVEEELDIKPLVFPCNLCTVTFPTSFALKRHKEKHIEEERETIKERVPVRKVVVYCKYCKVPFKGVDLLNRHMLNEHDQETAKASAQPKPQTRKFACGICKKVFDNTSALSSHQGWHKRGKFGRKILKHKERAIRSMLNNQPRKIVTVAVNEKHKCDTCYNNFPNDTALQIHILEKHRDVNATILNMSCNGCKLSFDSKSAYDSHIQLHKAVESQKSSKAHPCKYCPAGFSRSDTLNAHVRQHHKEHYHDVFKCTKCDRVFDKQNALTIHLKVHERQRLSGDLGPKPNHNKNIYFCSICDVGFAIAKDLRTHVVTAHPF